MARLGNPRHEEFAQRLARGEPQGESYAACGYRPSPAHASHLASRQDVRLRIAEIHAEGMREFNEGPSLAAIGITPAWLVNAYNLIKKAAMEAGDLKSANKAVESIESVLNFENSMAQKSDKPAAVGKIDVNALSGVLDKVSGIIVASKAPAQPATHQEQKALRAAENET
ncbi:hypothetical protein FGK63_14295 [Ruegeria sediminis]|uniref:Terminase small subunit n=1 Tax=Ruegeria sediminis TaxID=2583820 RepID=A0ABY2WUQ2_9RHOB|nr:hypothetical protein [Ruegeria sediminis]TMV06325.1 hypothetical protein FGK63_14295 [Ruegeria sediminis]